MHPSSSWVYGVCVCVCAAGRQALLRACVAAAPTRFSSSSSGTWHGSKRARVEGIWQRERQRHRQDEHLRGTTGTTSTASTFG
ncbi:hypothetical protein ABLN67_21600, partial [Mycobacterium tuberculosis]